MKMGKKNIFFAAALGLFVLSISYRLMNPYVQPRVDRLTYTGSGQGSEKITGKVKGSIETSAPPADTREKPKTSRRVYKDLFSVYKPPQKSVRDNSPPTPTVPVETIETVTKDPIGEIKEYIASYKFYGAYTSGEKKAVFLGKNKLVLVARTGDRIDGKYEIDDIQEELIRIKALELNETIDINIREFNND
jgi:hypothetical protein